MAETLVEIVDHLSDAEIADLVDATETAIVDGGGFGWLKSPPQGVLERFWRGVLLVPERKLFIGRLDGRVAGSAQLIRPPKNNEAQAFAASITTNFVSPWARGHGLARDLTVAVENEARNQGFRFLKLDVRDSQTAAIQLYESLGYERWGTNPNYATVGGKMISGGYYSKRLAARRGARRGQITTDEPVKLTEPTK
ncbi:MAG: GNAT family N-acetyltransferase [Rhodospirillales bacterium]|nr:GNAT family N-acetyltransferase [Rhodospirillales bacterium]